MSAIARSSPAWEACVGAMGDPQRQWRADEVDPPNHSPRELRPPPPWKGGSSRQVILPIEESIWGRRGPMRGRAVGVARASEPTSAFVVDALPLG